MSSSSFETSSFNVSEDISVSQSISSEEMSNMDPELLEVRQITMRQKQDFKKLERELLQTEKISKKWARTQVDTVAAIKDAELTTKQYEFERDNEEHLAAFAAKEAEVDNEIRQIDAECNELKSQIHSLEIELGEVKDKRKHDLNTVRSDNQKLLRNLEQKKIGHENQIEQLKNALQAVTEKHRRDIEIINDEAATSDQLIEIDTQRVSAEIERIRRYLSKTDQIHNRRMAEANQAIEMLKNEIEASKARSHQMMDESENTKTQISQMHNDLFKAEEQSDILTAQLQDAEAQKAEMRDELNKLNRAMWNERRAKLLRAD